MGYGLTIPYSMAMGLSRDDWTTAALEALAEVGLAAVAIDPLARRLGATKGSFYWHFSSRDELIAATLELWERRDTVDLLVALDAIEDPQERLVALARSAYGTAARGTDPQAGVLAAASDPRVGPVLERVTVARLAALERLFVDAGLGEEEAARRARLAYALYVGVIDLRRAAPSAPLAEDEIEAEIELMVGALVRMALGHGDLRPQRCPLALRAVERERPVERRQPVLQPAQPRPAAGVGAPDPVVGDLDGHVAVAALDHHRGLGRLRVLRDVGECLGDDEVGGALDRAGQALRPNCAPRSRAPGRGPPTSGGRARARVR